LEQGKNLFPVGIASRHFELSRHVISYFTCPARIIQAETRARFFVAHGRHLFSCRHNNTLHIIWACICDSSLEHRRSALLRSALDIGESTISNLLLGLKTESIMATLAGFDKMSDGFVSAFLVL
jgi:hypothetical protein